MTQETLIRISVHPYVRKYLLSHCTEGKLATHNYFDGISGIIINMLEPMPKVDAASFRPPVRLNHGATFSFRMTPHMVSRYGNYVSGPNVRRFNQLVHELIHGELFRLVQQLTGTGHMADKAIRQFQAYYGFTEDELPFENLKRWYYREKSKRALRVVHGHTAVEPAPDQLVLTYYEERNEPIYPSVA